MYAENGKLLSCSGEDILLGEIYCNFYRYAVPHSISENETSTDANM
jgi:hypothetical protein